jgi:hypothetical protein
MNYHDTYLCHNPQLNYYYELRHGNIKLRNILIEGNIFNYHLRLKSYTLIYKFLQGED